MPSLSLQGRARAQAVSRRLPTAAARVRSLVKFVVDKVALGMFSPSISVYPANSHSTNCSILIIYLPKLLKQAKQWPTCQVDLFSPHPRKLYYVSMG
jgi:hypothetical protein